MSEAPLSAAPGLWARIKVSRRWLHLGLRVGLLLALSWLLLVLANRAFYQPSREYFPNPDLTGLAREDVWFTSADGTRLHGWFLKAQGEPKATLVHFHGNAENISTHTSFVSWLPAQGYNVLVFDYRGYGESAGRPSRKGVYQDSLAAVSYALSRPDVDAGKVILFGQSLGGTQALAVAGSGEFPQLRAVIEESGFASYRGIASEKLWEIPALGAVLWPLSYVVTQDAQEPVEAVRRISPIPLLIVHGRQDGIVPYHHGEALYAAAGQPKWFWGVADGSHIDSFGPYDAEYRPRLLKFLAYAISRNLSELDPADQAKTGLHPSAGRP